MKSLSPDTAIEITHLSKRFHRQNQKTFKELLPALFAGQKPVNSFWALKDVDLQIQKGETVGIIGSNGSGKSTLLKIIAGVTQPSQGSIRVNGRIAPLIELGAGFHPELSGRENVFLNGVILGLSRKEVAAKFEKIVGFAELEEFIDEPVKHYSSGMYLRLAFSVAVHTDPEILLVDEILSVGDEAFQKKCMGWMNELKKKGTTIILVSHSLETVRAFCTRAIWISQGNVLMQGEPASVIRQYISQTHV